MPWQERTFMSLKCEFIVLHEAQARSFSALCLKFGISRKTGYKWLRRYESEGRNGLIDKRPFVQRGKRFLLLSHGRESLLFAEKILLGGLAKSQKLLPCLSQKGFGHRRA